ncbi:MAG: ABC transporter substrate-binding protein [Bacteroidetes bacterium]|nr:ABC transporter substrate-binding protein [Bacteroidota bacterium]
MPLYIDQTGRSLELHNTPQRIVSLVPSQTELLYDLGLNKEITGITKFCVHPNHWFRQKPRVGGTKNVDMKIIASIQPDLIIANKEENEKTQIEFLAENYPVWISDISTLDQALHMIGSLGEITDRKDEAKKMIATITDKFEKLSENIQQSTFRKNVTSAYLIWRNPYMSVGGDTFIHDMMNRCGFKNIFANDTRYPEINIGQLKIQSGHQATGCQLLLLPSEPFPFTKKHIDELQPLLPGTKIILVDGEMFSWYGSRLLQAPSYFQHLLQEMQQ